MQPLVWSEPSIAWASFDALVLRSCWDYHRRPDAFRAWLAAREREGASLHNSVALARWNVDKRYLRDLEETGRAHRPDRVARARRSAIAR